MFSSLLQAFAHQVETRANEVALVVPDREAVLSISWHQLAQKVTTQANALNRLFDKQSDVHRYVGYAGDNSLGDVLMALACPIAQVMEVPVDHRLGETGKTLAGRIGGLWLESHELAVNDSEPASNVLDQLRQAAASISVDQPALILWTSGTTEHPKAVTLTHHHLLINAAAKLSAVANSPDDVRLTSLPLCHAYARTCDFGTWLLSGCTLAVGQGFDAWKQLGPHVRPTVANAVPSLADRLLQSPVADTGIDRLRLLGCGGAAMRSDDFQAWKDRGVTVIQGYGLTETSPVICSATPDNATAGLVGQFVDGWEHQIREGRLFVRGPHVMAGYWNDAQATAARIVDGWLDTGDLVQLDSASGQLRILGRADEVIVLENGHKVHPEPIERAIERIEGVHHAMVVATGRTISVWLDANRTNDLASKIANALADRPTWERPSSVQFFDQPLSFESGELTAKGTIRRRVLQSKIQLHTRLGNDKETDNSYAGS